ATVQVCLVLDPMLATGGSATETVDILKKWGAKRIKYVGLIAAPEGVRARSSAHPDVPIHVAGRGEGLNEKGDIVPGLGAVADQPAVHVVNAHDADPRRLDACDLRRVAELSVASRGRRIQLVELRRGRTRGTEVVRPRIRGGWDRQQHDRRGCDAD